MIVTLRLLVCAGAVALAAQILEVANPGWFAELGIDLVSLPQLRGHLHEELALGRRLEAESAVLFGRAQIKQQILKDLIDGRLSLVETATQFGELNRTMVSSQPRPSARASSSSSEVERYCHEIIRAVECELSEQPRMAETVVARLKAELQAAAEAGVFCLLG